MSHVWWESRLSPLLDGELSPSEAKQMEEHVASCEPCRQRYGELARVSRSVRSLPHAPMPESLKASLMRRATEAVPRQPARRPFLGRHPWALASLASAAVMIVVVVVATRDERPVPNVREESTPESPATVRDDAPGPSTRIPDEQASALQPTGPVQLKKDRVGPTDLRERKAAATPPKAAKVTDSIATPDVGAGMPAGAPASGLAMRPAEPKDATGPMARYTTRLTFDDSETPVLSPIVPAASGFSQGPPMGMEGDATDQGSPSVQALRSAAPPALTFLASVGEDGRIESAEPIGAIAQAPTLVSSARALLIGAQLPNPPLGSMTTGSAAAPGRADTSARAEMGSTSEGSGSRRGLPVVIEVLLPATPHDR